jgi:site-specific DNA recombinase
VKRPPGKQWSAPTLRNIIRHNTYSGTREVRINGGEDLIEQAVPAIVERSLQERARAVLAENKRLSGGPAKRRNYLLTGLVNCDVCGCSCNGLANTARGKKYLYYKCNDDHPLRAHRAPAGHAPYVNARWLEELVWGDVKQFLENPGGVLERIREQLTAADGRGELEARRTDLAKRLAAKQAEKDRYVRAYAQGHISEDELAMYATDLKNQVENLKLLITSVESDLAQWEEHRMTAESTEAWLMTLRERVAEGGGGHPGGV